MALDTFVLLVIACLALNLSPGPSVLLVTSVSAAGGFKAGVFAVLGMTAGAFIHVLLVDSLNPKIALFFLAFIPQFLNSVETPGFLVSLALGSVFLITGIIVNVSIAWLVATGATYSSGKAGDWVQRWIPGSVLVFLGLRLLWQEN